MVSPLYISLVSKSKRLLLLSILYDFYQNSHGMICQKFKYVYHYPCYKNSKVCTRFFVKNKSIWSTLCSLYYLVVEIDYMSFDKEIDRQGSLSLPAGNAKKCLDAISIL